MKKINFLSYIILALVILGIMLANSYNTAVYLHASPSPSASVRLRVVNGRTNEPIYNACVCIPETGMYFYTDNNGNTPLIDVPVIINTYYDNILKRNFGEVTVLVSKQGYIDYLLFYLNVSDGSVRQGITVMMYQKQEGDPDYITIVESPDNLWTEKLIEKYKKKD